MKGRGEGGGYIVHNHGGRMGREEDGRILKWCLHIFTPYRLVDVIRSTEYLNFLRPVYTIEQCSRTQGSCLPVKYQRTH